MPTVVHLTRKSNNEFVSFPIADVEICKHFGEEPDKDEYFCGWYNSIAERFAYGRTVEQIRTEFQETLVLDLAEIRRHYLVPAKDDSASVYYWLLKILDFIEANYLVNVSHQMKY